MLQETTSAAAAADLELPDVPQDALPGDNRKQFILLHTFIIMYYYVMLISNIHYFAEKEKEKAKSKERQAVMAT